jgi:hypothetical protein
MKERMLQIANYYELSAREFSKRIGKSEGFVNSAKNITSDVMKNILCEFPDIDSYWLITGEGNMIKQEKNEFLSDANETMETCLHIIKSQQQTIEFLTKKTAGDTAEGA